MAPHRLFIASLLAALALLVMLPSPHAGASSAVAISTPDTPVAAIAQPTQSGSTNALADAISSAPQFGRTLDFFPTSGCFGFGFCRSSFTGCFFFSSCRTSFSGCFFFSSCRSVTPFFPFFRFFNFFNNNSMVNCIQFMRMPNGGTITIKVC